ncbi:CocE/NonD family hydrolase [Natronococcus wangiae]|uniref:CocE/NonD family hydrolase n=1 Tax=Natronococcus wangiae TaxID=3068275 RepID=UPI00273E715C|nr:CocE/NonD family hydrolase [Natronococcus sp. AD5]
MNDSDHDSERRDVTRRTLLQATAAGTAGLSTSGLASADDDPIDEPLPVEDPPADFVCDPNATEHYTEVSLEPTHDFGEEETVELESDQDGKKIQIGVLKPDLEDGERVPVILRATPYVDDLREKSLRDCVRTERLTENYVEQGYAVAAVAVRGTGGSGGCMELFGPNEQADVDQAVTYLGEAAWSNGNVGIIGRSYDGSTPWMAARMGNPHLATVVPFSGVPDMHDLMYRRGAPEPRGYAILPGLYYAISIGIHSPASGTGLATYLERASCPDNYTDGSVWSLYAGATGERDPSGYWTERILRRGVARNYEGSVLMVHGLQDWNVNPSQVYPWTDDLREAGIRTHIYFAQFGHHYPDDGRIQDTDAYNEHWADFLLAWFESELKGRDEAVVAEEINAVDVFDASVHAQHSGGEWYTADEWPPAEAEETDLFLGTDGNLRATPDSETGEETIYVDETRSYDPTQPSDPEPGCRACATFVSAPFEDDFRFAGEPELALTVTPTASGGHLTAYLWAVDEDDAERLGWGQIDLRYADDSPAAEYPTPGEELDVSLPIEPLDATVPEGQRLAVVLHQGTTGDRTYSPTPAPVVVETGGDNGLALQAWNAGVPRASLDVDGTRADSGSVFTGGQTNRTDLAVAVRQPADETVLVRDTVPDGWTVDEEHGDVVATAPAPDGDTHVYFGLDEPRSEYDALTHFASAPDDLEESGEHAFGPIAVTTETDDSDADEGPSLADREWTRLEETDRDVIVTAVNI